MYVFYEEDGDIKAGTILSESDASLQLESQHGKRTKIKAQNILLRYPSPAPGAAMEGARQAAGEIDLDFLWEVAGENEFAFADLARDYYGGSPDALQAGAILLTLHQSPIYFYKKGKGRYKAAPGEALAAAKAALERKAREVAQKAEWVAQLVRGELPVALGLQVFQLLHKPDKNSLEYKALQDACTASGLTPVALLDRCGAIPSSHEYHLQAFLLEHFPRGTGFPTLHPPAPPPALPPADSPAFSIDDAATTEIDDAFSVIFRPDGGARVGIHIAAPALGLLPDSDLDRVAAGRLSTVYMPGGKITMLPEGLIDHYTLAENRDCPALSLYVEVAPDYTIRSLETRPDQVRIATNLRHETLEPLFNEDSIRNPAAPDYPYRRELEWLWGFASHLEAARGKADQVQRLDYLFRVEGDRIAIQPRVRGNPIDRVVSELMILANSRWGGLLADKGVAGIYRAQTSGKVRMTLQPAPHEGLGLEFYSWSTSPLRRYVDLVNQRQILAAVADTPPPYAANDPRLFAALRDFELAYDAYNDFQRRMERYWCLRWLVQEGITEIRGSVLKENLVRLEGLPYVARVSGAPAMNPGQGIRLAVGEVDLLNVDMSCRYLGDIPATAEAHAPEAPAD